MNYIAENGTNVNLDFKKYKVTKERKKVIYLTQDELIQLYQHDYKKPNLNEFRDLFVLQCSTGLRISDLSRLGKQHIKGDIIEMTAFKIRIPYISQLLPLHQRSLINTRMDYPR